MNTTENMICEDCDATYATCDCGIDPSEYADPREDEDPREYDENEFNTTGIDRDYQGGN